MISYLFWVILALIAYSVIGPIVKVIETDVPTETDVAITTAVMLVVTVITAFVVNPVSPDSFSLTAYAYAISGGIFLTVGVITFFRALREGPVSIVVPIYGLFIVMSSLIGIVFFNERYTTQKIIGIVLAIVAIYLTSQGAD